MVRLGRLAVLIAVVLGVCSAQDARGFLRSEDGWIVDPQGRVVILRGVNFPAGLRVPEVADKPPEPMDEQAAAVQKLGFNVARVQIAWAAIEPGTARSNEPAICAPGPPRDPGQWDEGHAQAYLDRVENVVDALSRHGVYSLFQITQYGYNRQFGGPYSHPDWAVCTDGLPITEGSGPTVYAQPGMWNAAEHFWKNDVQGDLQGEYNRMLRALATRFAGDDSVAGYELYNEPFSGNGWMGDGRFDGLVQCFYMGSRDPGRLADGSRPDCPPGVPAEGAIPQMRAADPDHALHPQAHIFTNFGVPTLMGPLPARNLVFNFHVYCVSGLGQQVPDELRGPECDTTEEDAVEDAERTRRAMASARQPRALPAFLSEFGFGDNEAMLRHMTELADRHLLGWAYFTWRNDDGPDHSGVLRNADGTLRPKVRLLARPYPAAIAGVPNRMDFDPDERRFVLRYGTSRAGGGHFPRGLDSRVSVPEIQYRNGYRLEELDGAGVASGPDAEVLRLVTDAGAPDVGLAIGPRRAGEAATTCRDALPPRARLLRRRSRLGRWRAWLVGRARDNGCLGRGGQFGQPPRVARIDVGLVRHGSQRPQRYLRASGTERWRLRRRVRLRPGRYFVIVRASDGRGNVSRGRVGRLRVR